MPPEKLLTSECKPGERVHWSTVDGQRHTGRLKEWDNGTAIIAMADGTEKAVRAS